MCTRFAQPIDAVGAGFPLVTVYRGLAYWQETGATARDNLCCVNTDGALYYSACQG